MHLTIHFPKAKGAAGARALLNLIPQGNDRVSVKSRVTLAAYDGTDLSVLMNNGVRVCGIAAVARYVVRGMKVPTLYDELNAADAGANDYWMDFAAHRIEQAGSADSLKELLVVVEEGLKSKEFLVGEAAQLGDVVLWSILKGNANWGAVAASFPAVSKWFAEMNNIAFPPKVAQAVPAGASAQSALRIVCQNAINKAFPELEEEARVMPSPNEKFGHYQCMNGMSIMKLLQSSPNPPKQPAVVAQAIVDNMEKSDMIQKAVVGNGFINIWLEPKWGAARLMDILRSGVTPPYQEKRTAAVDFSSPNIAKEMHVGHLRSTIIGESICRMLEYCGHTVHRINHVGDWGTQFGMLITFLKDNHPDFAKEEPRIGDLQEFYKASKKRFDEDPDFKKRSQLEVVNLQSGDPVALKAWNLICEVSRREFQKLYDRLDVTLKEVGESFYNDMIPKVVTEVKEKGMITDSDGAQCIFTSVTDIPLMVVKRDGGYGYDSTDLAAIKYRLKELKCDWLVYITDVGQQMHFNMIFEAARQAGWVEPTDRIDHVGFGLVTGADGKKFKTRSGETVRLVDLLDEAVDRCAKICTEKDVAKDKAAATVDEDMALSAKATAVGCGSVEEFQKVRAKRLGYGAVKYADLRQNRTSDYQFDYDKMLALEGDAALYLLYAYARISSMSFKAKKDVNELKKVAEVSVEHKSEWALAVHLLRFPELVEMALQTLMPHHLCKYLFVLSQKFNDFYRDCRVIGDPKEANRLLLAECAAAIMKKTFDLLGINALERI